MKIAILEICTPTHYTLTNALIKTYSTDPNNTIVVYTLDNIAKILVDGGISAQTSIVIFDKTSDKTNTTDFFKNIEKTAYDRLHICTIEDYFEDFVTFKPNAKDLFFHIHDIDLWFDLGFKSRFQNLLFDLKNNTGKIRSIARFGKDVLIRQPLKQKILRGLLGNNPYYIVMSNALKNNLSQHVSPEKIVIFPTLINEGITPKLTQNNGKVRIGIPGIITDERRDYSGLFKILNTILPQIKDKLIVDLLGRVDKKELHLADKIKDLQAKGLDITYSLDFIDAITFDEMLDKADILLNNQTMNVSHTGQYGATKESGMIFNIVRGSKPAIFPKAYVVDDEFENVMMYYDSETALIDILLGLANHTIDIEQYKTNAIELGKSYTPENLYSRLVKDEATKTTPQYLTKNLKQ
jgi:hypothetical protein